jgi:hypothetical protein
MNQIKSIFEIAPIAFNYTTETLIFAILLILGSIVFSFAYKKFKKNNIAFKRIYKNLSKNLSTYGILFLLLDGFRYESIPFFSMRLWIYITVLAFIYTTIKYIIATIKTYPSLKKEIEMKRKKSHINKNSKKYTTKKK